MLKEVGVIPRTHYLPFSKDEKAWLELRERINGITGNSHRWDQGVFIQEDYPGNPFPGDYTIFAQREIDETIVHSLQLIKTELRHEEDFSPSVVALIRSLRQKLVLTKAEDVFNPMVAKMILDHENTHRMQRIRTAAVMPDAKIAMPIAQTNRELHNELFKLHMYSEAQAMAVELTGVAPEHQDKLKMFTYIWATKLVFLFKTILDTDKTQLTEAAEQFGPKRRINFAYVTDPVHSLGLAINFLHDPDLLEKLENGTLSPAALDANMKIMLYDLLEKPLAFLDYIKQPDYIINLDQKMLNSVNRIASLCKQETQI